ncbi:MAG: DEAD/DEAH box helicase [Planctomycetota bacterium]
MPQKTGRSRGGPRRGSGGRSRGAHSAAPKKSYAHIKPLEPTLEPPDIENFTEFSLSETIQQGIAGMGITKPTPIQALAIEPVLKGKDVIAKAETGTGKTLAFGAPMMSKIDPDRSTVLGLVLSPTRELAEQVHDVLEELGKANGVKTALVVGGEQMGPQVRAIQAGAQVIVGTPGRVLDLLNQRFLQFPWTEFAVLDEADKMLEIGFIDDVKKILDACNEYRQTLLFSATFPPPLLELARGYTTDPVEIATASGVATVDTIDQYVLRCSEDDRARNLGHLIEDSGDDDVFLVFCERRTDVDRLMRQLERRRFSVKALHGGYDQAARFRVMSAFRTGEVKCLVATDVASRGLDVKHVTHVVNLGVPRDVSDYTHRIGRTGRAGRTGTAVTFVSRMDERRYRDLLDRSGFDITEIERPRDLFKPKRKPRRDEGARDDDRDEKPRRRPRRDEREDREERPRRRGRGRDDAEREREDKPRRSRGRDRDDEREERPRRPKRSDEREREERPRRRARSDRDGSPDRDDAPDLDETPRRKRRTRPDRDRAERDRADRDRAERDRDESGGPREERRPRRERAEREERDSSDERPRRRPRREDRPAEEERPRRRPRRDESSDDEPRPRRSRPRTEDSNEDRPRRSRRSRDDGDGPREERKKPRRARPDRDEDERPAAKKTDGGFGLGLESGSRGGRKSASEDERPARRKPKRESRDERPKRKEDPAPKKAPSGGFGSGI